MEVARCLVRSLNRMLEIKRSDAERRERYRRDPVAYLKEVHGVTLWHKQREIMRSLVRPPRRVMAESGNAVGKTHVAGGAGVWFYKNFDPSIGVITGPRAEQLSDTTFKEIRRLLRGSDEVYPKNPEVYGSFEHRLRGTTASDATAFQGVHDAALMLIYEEATGIDAQFWEAARGILSGGEDESVFWLSILNPTDRDCQAFVERDSADVDGNKQWTVIRVSQVEHPNILHDLCEVPAPIPAAVRLRSLRSNLTSDAHWGAWIEEADYNPEVDVDLWDGAWYGLGAGEVTEESLLQAIEENGETLSRREFIGLSPGVTAHAIAAGFERFFPRRYWRPGPLGDSRILGRYPRQPAYAVFHDGMFEAAEKASLSVDLHAKVEIGCDVARFGDDMTVVHVQRGGLCLEHESRANSDTKQTALWLQDRIEHWARVYELDPRTEVIVRIDDTGVGGGVTDNAMGYTFIPVVAQRRAMRDERYPDARSEMSFNLAEAMADGRVSTARLPEPVRREIRRQAEKVMWKQDTRGRRRVYPKSVVKDALGRSPDDLDAMALAHYPLGRGAATIRSSGEAKSAPVHRREFSSGTSRLFG